MARKSKKRVSDREIAKKNIQKKTIENEFVTNLKLFFIIGTAIVLAGFASLQLYLNSQPPIKNLEQFKPNIVTKFYSQDGEVIKTFTAYTYSKVDIKDVPKQLKEAFIATEDKNFYHHNGYDIVGLVRSSVQNILARKVVQGASTITQQLARILFLSNEKTFTRKIKELVIAARIEKTISKDQILEMYMNNVYLGSGAYGVEGAAKIYFNKTLKDCSLPELALIAGLPQAPSVYSPYNNLDFAIKRRNQVLTRMYKMRYISKKEYEEAKKADVKLNEMPKFYTTNKAPYFCDFIMKELISLGFDETEIIHGGYKVVTTLDSKTQDAANEAVLKNLKNWGLSGDAKQAAVFSYDPSDGKILAYVGGKDYTKSQYDRVTQAVRPPGSAFKPIVYAAGLERGISPNDYIEDMPVAIGDWAPRNYADKYRGQIPIYSAMMVSSNVCAARMIYEVGIRSVIQIARVLGIETPLAYDYTIALGSNGVKLFEFTRAYGAFANGGYVVQPYGIERVETSRGKVIYRASKTKISHQISLRTAAEMTAMLKTVIAHGTGRAANIGKPAAGKTGTTDDNKDAYFVGYTPNIVTGVWVGSDDNSVMNKSIQGGTVPALIWKDVMQVATEPYGNAEFNYPQVTLDPFTLDPNNVKIIKQGEDYSQEEQPSEENQENSENGIGKFKLSPQQLLKNMKFNNQQMPPMPQVQQLLPPTEYEQPTAREQVQVTPPAPTPIPMAIPESLN
ncbi:MAG: PBP1A family penicillin-binding protein [Cyanobacteria bacterium SIG32]|nr:PBP1A family penicillin-binding protein [Cyanobacteria bacterium SIG32]